MKKVNLRLIFLTKSRMLLTVASVVVLTCTSFAQDVIVTRDSKKIEAKVTEINVDNVRYKNFDNQDGPTYTLPKSNIVTIIYQNGQVEMFDTEAQTQKPAGNNNDRPVIEPSAATAVSAASQQDRFAQTSEIRGPHRKNFYTGIYFNPLSVALLNGASLGAEFTFARKFIIEPYLRFPRTSLYFILEEDIENGFGFGFAAKYFTGGRKGGFYVGPNFEFNILDYDEVFLFLGTNLGYKFQFASGFYMRAGASLGAQIEIDYETLPWGNLEFCFGISF